jgi:hypothetical protein
LFEDAVGGDADGIFEAEELADLVELWQSETGGNVATADVSIGVIAAQTLDATQKSLK